MFKPLKLAAIASVVALALAGCGGKANPSAAPSSAAAGKTTKIAVAYDSNGRDDASFNAITYVGLNKAATDLGLELKEVTAAKDAPQSSLEDMLNLLATDGYNPVIAVGYAYAPALANVAAAHPDTTFGIVDNEVDAPNVSGLMFSAEQGSYLVGVIAAQATKSKHLGFVGGQDIPMIQAFYAGFVQGAHSVSADIKVDAKYLAPAGDDSGWDAADKAKAAAAGMYSKGADVIYHASGLSGLGVFQAAKSAGTGHWAIGVDTDQYTEPALAAYKSFILTSMLKRIDTAVYDLVKSVVDGNPMVGPQTFDLSRDGLGYSKSNKAASAYFADADKAAEAIKAGTIVVSPK